VLRRFYVGAVGLVVAVLLGERSALSQFAPPQWSTVPAPGAKGRTGAPRVGRKRMPAASSGSALEPIEPLTASQPLWPSPSLNPGVPSAFIANWGDIFVVASAATASDVRNNVDGSWVAGFGIGDATRNVALELSGGCGSVNNFCANGGFGVRLSRVLINQPTARVAVAGGWQNGLQWGNEGRQDNIYSATLTYALPLRPSSTFGQTMQFNAGVGNSTFAPYSATNSESNVGGFGSIGVELTPALGVSAGWSGRGMNAQLSYTPLRDSPLTLSLLGADLLNQTPDGTVGVFTVSWGTTFSTPDFNR
jgi:hypothetical protein